MKTLMILGFAVLFWASGARADDAMARAWQAFDGGDYAAARDIWRDLSRAGDASAKVALAGMYQAGTGVRQDAVRARQLYAEAADLGNADAMQNLAEMLEPGQGGRADPQAALVWYRRAAAAGRSWAADQVKRLQASGAGPAARQ